ncbi:MAG: NAD(P)/FAD-dependent oxidoreductase [Clostridium sp.]|jgi:predicted Rossmann fold flavoprotein|nr:NAD(P)/FAD-dependent oxidoreductase [Clostridium sp.]
MGRHTAVIGGGASGMTAAITAAREGCRVTLYEAGERLGRKLLATGNGKCNLGNLRLSRQDYYGKQPERVEACLERFSTEDTVRFFAGLGLLLKEKSGYLYPLGAQAAAVLDVLRYEIQDLGILVRTGCKIDFLRKSPGKESFIVGFQGQRAEHDKVILACGGKAAPKTGSDGSGLELAGALGHTIVATVPALVPLKCREGYCKALAGVRAEGEVRIWEGEEELACETGEIQFTEYGLSGIPVFQLSRIVNYRLLDPQPRSRELKALIDFLPGESMEQTRERLTRRLLFQGGRTAEEFFTGILHKKLMSVFLKLAGVKPGALVADLDRERLWEVFCLCRRFPMRISASLSYDHAQASAGGVDLEELTDELESRKVPGLYFAGEILDVDGKCGGYNLHWAWCSGSLAGTAAARA